MIPVICAKSTQFPNREILRKTSAGFDVHPTGTQSVEVRCRIVHSTSQNGEERYDLRISECGDCRLTIITAKSRTVAVRLMSMAMTGFFMTFRRPRTHRPLSMLKYDPVGKS